MCGGSARPESHELVGPLADQTLSKLNVDLAFVGVDGITAAGGLTTHHEVEADDEPRDDPDRGARRRRD